MGNDKQTNYKWLERLITLILIVAGSFSGYLVDKTRMEGRIAAVEKLSSDNKVKLDEANLGLILYRMDKMEASISKMEGKVDDLNAKIDESTTAIINSFNNNRRSR